MESLTRTEARKCLRWTITASFGGRVAMAGPSGGSPGSSATPESPSGRFSNIPSPTQRLGIASHQNLVPSTRLSTRFFWTTRLRRPNSVTPRRRCSVAFATNMTTSGGYAQVQRYVLKHRRREARDLYSAGSSSGPTLRSRFRPYPRRFPRRTLAHSVRGCYLGLLQLSLRSGTAI